MATNTLSPELLSKMDAYWRAANYLTVGSVEMRMALLVPIAVTTATPLCLLKLVATPLRLAAPLTVAVDCFSEIFLGPVDALLALAVVIARLSTHHTARQQQYS